MAELIRITLIGPECSGKTTLARALSRHFGSPWSREYARSYVEMCQERVKAGDRTMGRRPGDHEERGKAPPGAQIEDLTPADEKIEDLTPAERGPDEKNEDLTPADGKNEDLTPGGGDLRLADVGPIAVGSIVEMERAIELARGLVIHDTDLISTVVYSRHYYGTVEAWIDAEARRRRADHYLLLSPEFAWSADGVRDRPNAREQLYGEFRSALIEFEVAYSELRGDGEQRLRRAIELVEYLAGSD